MSREDNAHRIFAEDGSGNDSDDSGLDILKASRKGLTTNMSQFFDVDTLTQSRSQPKSLSRNRSLSQRRAEHAKRKPQGWEFFEDSDDEPARSRPKPRARNHGGRKRPSMDSCTETETEPDTQDQDEDQHSESDWSAEDPSADYRAFKERKTLKRKAVAAETNRLRAAKKSRVVASTSIVGRKKPDARKIKDRSARAASPLASTSDTEGADGKNTYLDDPTPEYIEARKRKLKKLHDAGLRYPPYYDDIDFSDSEAEEKPILHPDIKTQRKKEDIELRETHAFIPAPIAQWLRDYQVDGVRFLHEKFVRQTGAILGDDMGLGKTIQVIAFLTAAFGKTATKLDAKCMRKIRRMSDNRWYPRILIVCPGSLMRNWEDELGKWGWWHVDKFHGNPKDKSAILDAIRGGRLEIMITTYSTYRNSESEINTIDWDCVIADECHQIKSKDAETTKAMNRVNALCRIGLTGTAIQNKYEEMWNLLNWARPSDYGSHQEWKQTVALPLKIGQAHDATHAQLAMARTKAKELVETILPDVFLRRMKTLIADQLPKKSDRVVFCQLTETQAEAYRNFIDSDMVEYVRRAREPCDCDSKKTRGWCCYQEIPGKGKWGHFMFPAMVTLTKLANHLALLLPQTTDIPEKQAKDLENLQLACPDNWQDLYRIKDNILNQSQRSFCGKWSVLKRLLNFWHQNGDKVLVFSHSVRLLRLLKTLFDIDGTKYNWSYLDGGMTLEDRAKAVSDFNSNPSQFVFLISTKAGGVGLNITSANKVVVMDPNWNPAYDLQAQDRAYRIGQTRDVEVFRLVSSGTIEEIIYARQIYKQQQANIAYTAADERRYFKGVMDNSEKKGELFGLENLFSFEEDGYMLRDIVRKTNVAETRVGVSAMDFHLSDNDDSDDDDILSNKSLGITDDADDGPGDTATSQMKNFAQRIVTNSANKSKSKTHGNGKRQGPDPINAILAKAGVQYTHENSEVIGYSKIEAELSRRALEVSNDLELGAKRVFQFSQSQRQKRERRPSPRGTGFEEGDVWYSQSEEEIGNSDNDFDDEDVRITGTRAPMGDRKEFKIKYKYRPKEDICSRQFCSMTKMMGYEDPVEFALLVEGMTSEERRGMLERFYRVRRREVGGFGG